MFWLTLHLVAVAVLTGLGWVVQLVVYPAFALVGEPEWPEYHARHSRGITLVVALPWAVQGVSTVALLVDPPRGLWPSVALAALAAVTVGATVAAAVPVHNRLARAPGAGGPELRSLLRANLIRTIAWTGATALAGWLLG